MGKLSYNDKLHMHTFREQGLGAKSIISSYTDKGWKLSSVKEVCCRVDHTDDNDDDDDTGSAVLRKPGSGIGRPATAFSFFG